jgi:hypothetical protein
MFTLPFPAPCRKGGWQNSKDGVHVNAGLLKQFANPPSAFRGKPFWAWNGKLEPAELRRQIRVMRRMGLGGFFMHSRVGLDTPYLADEWFESTVSRSSRPPPQFARSAASHPQVAALDRPRRICVVRRELDGWLQPGTLWAAGGTEIGCKKSKGPQIVNPKWQEEGGA